MTERLVPEPTDEMIAAGVATFGGIVGSPENLAKPEYVERMKNNQRKAVISHYKAMRALEPAAAPEPVSEEPQRFSYEQVKAYADKMGLPLTFMDNALSATKAAAPYGGQDGATTASHEAPAVEHREAAAPDEGGHEVAGKFTCGASHYTDLPNDCNWPLCDCDPYASKVIAALQEAGKL